MLWILGGSIVWTVLLLVVVALCKAAKRGDECHTDLLTQCTPSTQALDAGSGLEQFPAKAMESCGTLKVNELSTLTGTSMSASKEA